jgi:hypothetical protein
LSAHLLSGAGLPYPQTKLTFIITSINNMALRLKDIPFCLRATDIVKHILNIDSRFRESNTDSSSKFTFKLLAPVKNVLRIRITSIEMPNNYYIFSENRRNITICIVFNSTTATIKIPPGNYDAYSMETTLKDIFASNLTWLSVSFNQLNGKFTFSGTQPFSINTICSDDDTFNRPYDYGLGYNLGFSRGIFTSDTVNGKNLVVSDQCSMFAGDPYVLLKINAFDCVRQTVTGNDFTALAKIVLKEPKNFMTFDDYASQHAKEITFPNPQDLSRFQIQLLDPYGYLIDMCSSQISFSIEVLEVRNLSLYNTIRDAFAAGWSI